MKHKLIIGLSLLGIVAWLLLLRILELKEVRNLKLMPFSADVVQVDSEGQTKIVEKVFLGLKNERIETGKTISIYRGDLSLMWILTTPPSPLTYVEVPVKQKHTSKDSTLRSSRFPSESYLGIKMIDGQKTYEFSEPRESCKVSTFVSSKTLIPLGMNWYCGKSNRVVMKFTNVKPGEPPAGIFEIPGEYRRVDAPDLLETGKTLNPR